ncbi:type II toxin-antitoxin system VapC family toxin [Armatimonas sp.]|uniref:type II toxin-antitoxin system VapC family toxin n=1 Tax=Armatimonas sp. TaxID=1872638 RepID=UPI0037534AA8
MKLLLDTHIFLWFINGDPRLSSTTLAALRNVSNEVYLSSVSCWEITVKYQLGKLPLPDSPDIFLSNQRRLHNFYALPLEEDCIGYLLQLPTIHRDPFDRMLISQALYHGLTLVSEDAIMHSYPVPIL